MVRRVVVFGSLAALVMTGVVIAVLKGKTAPSGVPDSTALSAPTEIRLASPPVIIQAPRIPASSSSKPAVVFMGDVMLDRMVATRMRNAGSLLYPFEKVKDSQLFAGDDLLVANLEGPVTAKRRDPVKSIDFAFDPSVVPILKQVGIDAVSQANNHSLDQGRLGAEESKKALRDGGLAVFGDEVRDDPSSSLAVVPFHDKKIAFLGFNVTDNPLDEAEAEASITAAKKDADVVFVFMHWGQEYQPKPSADQTRLAHWFIDHGVDVVIGGHPHWMQSVEVYRGHPVVYSLGNAVFDQDWSPETQRGLAVRVRMDGTAGTVDLYPVGIIASQMVVLDGAERQSRLDRLASISDPALAPEIRAGAFHFSW